MSARRLALAWAVVALACGAARAQPYPAALPPAETVRAWLHASPEMREARARMDLGGAEAKRLRAGTYEWTARATVQRRNEVGVIHYHESGLALERPLRWGGKAGKDAALADQRMKVADSSYADMWHEAARAFVAAWFGALREARAAALLSEQLALQDRQVAIARQRLRAGDAAQLDLRLAEGERDRIAAAAEQARRRAEQALAAMREHYGDSTLQLPSHLPEPAPLAGSVAEWTERIMSDNHEIELADEEAGFAGLAAQRKALDRIPDPTVGVHYFRERDGQERLFGLTLSLPLPGQARSTQANAAAAEAAVAQEQAGLVRNRVRRAALAAAMAAQSDYDNWVRLAGVAKRSGENADLAWKAYALGESSIADALLARRQALDAQNEAQAAQVDALHSQTSLLLDSHAILSANTH